ncbi:hypothetical protein LXL04_017421 [Taraxacum kok-saghyz]
MEGSRRRDSSSPLMLPDLTATQGCENESSPSSSDLNSNSSLTFDNSKSRLYQIEDSAKDCVTAWTDEKHDLYLDHLESSFVEQLHRSLGLLSWCSDKDSKTHYSSQKSIAKTQNTYDKFKLMQDDCLDKIDHKRKKNHKFADHRNDVAEFSDQNFETSVCCGVQL